jgi:pSer/pThr/pTyr-binding forkhead associated (FHA) protein
VPFLKHIVNGNPVGFIELVESISIGRAEANDIVVADPTISSRHADIVKNGGVWELRDNGSTNGTSVKGKKVDTVTLSHGTVLGFGTQNFEFCETITVDDSRTLKIKKSWLPGVYYTE